MQIPQSSLMVHPLDQIHDWKLYKLLTWCAHTTIEQFEKEAMCSANSDAPIQIYRARETLLRLQSVVAKHNARIRIRYPRSHPVRAAVEKHLSGTFNDLPSPIHVFAHHAEDAACFHENSLGVDPLDVFTDGMSELIDDARAWAGKIVVSDLATPWYPKKVSLVEEHLFYEIACRARDFFAAVYATPCVNARSLAKAETEFWKKYHRAEAALSRAVKDHSVAIQTKLVLSQRMPPPVA